VFEMASVNARMRLSAISLAMLFGLSSSAFSDGGVAGQVTASLDSGVGGSVADGEHVKLGEEGACSILLDEDAVVELCGQTSVVFKRDPKTNRRIVSLESGELRIVVEPREFEERIEIHTPAAIATLLGTIVHVSVDPATGETTITSAESKVSVRSDQAAVSGTTVLTPGEQVTVDPGQAPPATPKRLDDEEFDELGGCLVNFHVAAADRDSRENDERVTERLTTHDAANAGPIPGAAPGDRPRGGPGSDPGDPLTGQEGVCVATDCDPTHEHQNDQDYPTRSLNVKF
jgi:hypothetical protein